jgi:ABC-2 type transport system permease protein
MSTSLEQQPHATLSEPRPMYWSIRREIWENRSIYIAPLIVTAFVLFGSFISMASMPHRMRTRPANDPARQHALVRPLSMSPAPIMFTTFLVGMFYCFDALYGERRDRSILFWKSLPVSDRTTVLSKASIPLVVLPSIAFALSVFTQLALLMLTFPILLGNGMSTVAFSSEFNFFEGLLIMAYGLTVHALWFAPIYGWFLLISAWAKRAPLLWAVMPLLMISALERMAFNTWTFMYMLQYRLMGAMKEAFTFTRTAGNAHGGDIEGLSQLHPLRFLSAPGLWVGLIFAAGCIALAIRLRRDREPI